MARYRIRYKDDDNVNAEYGFCDTEADALGWWESMTTGQKPGRGPRHRVLEREEGSTWVIVGSHAAQQAE